MNEPKTIFYDDYMNRKIYYDLHENGLTYRTDAGKKLSLSWEDIQYIEDIPGDRVDIVIKNKKEVPVRYAANKFSLLLKTVCAKIADIHSARFTAQEFTLTLSYMIHLSFVGSVVVLLPLGSLLFDYTLFLLFLAFGVPIGMVVLRQPVSLILNNDGLTIQKLITKQSLNFNEIQSLNFEVKSNQYGSTLCILMDLKNGEKMVLQKFQNIILLFVMLQAKINEGKNG
jgi:hypothetical protein